MSRRKTRIEQVYQYIDSIKDEEGYAVLDINLRDGADIYNPLSMGENRDLSSDIYDYIDNETSLIPAEIPLKIKFHAKLEEEEQEKIKVMMKRHYTLKANEILLSVAANFRKVVIMSLFGVILLGLYFYFAFSKNEMFFGEILSIVGSFSLWEVADALFLERPRLRRERKNAQQNIDQVIEFEE